MTVKVARKNLKNAAKEEVLLSSTTRGLALSRRFTRLGHNPLDEIRYTKRDSLITNPDGSVVFRMEGIEVPDSWSQLATDILISKYIDRKSVV